jgi:CDP-diacylglycerol--glycerol-3-phosphate 3-phosphatidyltransferase/cardiolipin synthase
VKTGQPEEYLRWWALGFFVTAAATDGVDGWVARRFNQISKFGAYIDPIADKVLLLTGVLVLSITDWGPDHWRLPAWFAVIVFLRDTIIMVGVKYLQETDHDVRISPHWTGKFCTVAQMFALGWVMLKVVPLSPAWPCAVAVVFTVWSTVAYIRTGLKILRGPKTA